MKSLKECKNPLEFLVENFGFRKPMDILGLKAEEKEKQPQPPHNVKKHKNKQAKKSRRRNRK